MDRTDGSTESVNGIPVHCMTVEEGAYTQAEHCVTMEAVKYMSTVTDRSGSWMGEIRGYTNSYVNPVVLGRVMTYNDANFSTFWSRGTSRGNPPSSSVLRVGKHIAEDPNQSRLDETVGYVVVEAGNGTMGAVNYVAVLGTDSIRGVGNSPPYSYSLSGLLAVSAAIVSSAGMDGGNGGWPILYGATPVATTSLALGYEEDQARDSERNHTTEQVAYIVFD